MDSAGMLIGPPIRMFFIYVIFPGTTSRGVLLLEREISARRGTSLNPSFSQNRD